MNQKAEINLINGLKSDNDGLKFSSAYLLGEIKSQLAVDYLVRILRAPKDYNYRIMAALSLSKMVLKKVYLWLNV